MDAQESSIFLLTKDLDLDLEDTITLQVWLTENSPKLEDTDWNYVKSETRASSAELLNTSPPKDCDSFEVEESKIYFVLEKN